MLDNYIDYTLTNDLHNELLIYVSRKLGMSIADVPKNLTEIEAQAYIMGVDSVLTDLIQMIEQDWA